MCPSRIQRRSYKIYFENNVNFPELIFECMDAISLNMNYVAQKKKFNFNEGTKIVALERLLYIESRLHKLEFYIMEDKLKNIQYMAN